MLPRERIEPVVATPAGRCPRCLFPLRTCLCAHVPALAPRTRVVIIRHETEIFRASNSGRLAHLALAGSAIIDHGGQLPDVELTDRDGAWLLYPEGEVAHAAPVPPPRTLVVLDGTWAQARRMYRKLDTLRGLPMMRLADAPMPEARLRASPAPGRVSTIEAIARALRLLEGDDMAAPLEQLFAVAVAHARASG
jgi:DTW domain-containing protein YfiP